jgi:hypothetical protein
VLDVVNLRCTFKVQEPAEGSIEAHITVLAELQQKGLLRYVGLSNVTPAQIVEARQITPIVCVQNMYNLAYSLPSSICARIFRLRCSKFPRECCPISIQSVDVLDIDKCDNGPKRSP